MVVDPVMSSDSSFEGSLTDCFDLPRASNLVEGVFIIAIPGVSEGLQLFKSLRFERLSSWLEGPNRKYRCLISLIVRSNLVSSLWIEKHKWEIEADLPTPLHPSSPHTDDRRCWWGCGTLSGQRSHQECQHQDLSVPPSTPSSPGKSRQSFSLHPRLKGELFELITPTQRKKAWKEMSYFRWFEWSHLFQAPSSFNQIYRQT